MAGFGNDNEMEIQKKKNSEIEPVSSAQICEIIANKNKRKIINRLLREVTFFLSFSVGWFVLETPKLGKTQ